MKSSKGITLIALVITIIVLLILAGVSIAMLTGNNSILKQAENAELENILAIEKEKASIEFQTLMSQYYEEYYVDRSYKESAFKYLQENYKDGDCYTVDVVTSTTEIYVETNNGATGTININGIFTWDT